MVERKEGRKKGQINDDTELQVQEKNAASPRNWHLYLVCAFSNLRLKTMTI
jgi:hypothetical protein